MRLLSLFLCLFLLSLTLSDNIQPKVVDVLGTLCSKAPSKIDRVVLQSNVSYIYVLPVSSGWEQFPDMILNYTIKQAQYVKIGYHLSLKLNKCSQFGTRVIIDGQENTYFRSYTGNLYYHNHVVFVPVWT